MNRKLTGHFFLETQRRAGSVLIGVLALALLPLCTRGQPLYAAGPDKPAHPSAGMVNDRLREDFPSATAWDIGGQWRVRYEARDAGSFPNRDFARDLDHGNDYLLVRTKVHLGWSPTPWFTAYVEGRDARAVPQTDSFDLHQAHVRVGDLERFPFSLQVGRQELVYGDQRYIGNSDWSNFGRSFDAVNCATKMTGSGSIYSRAGSCWRRTAGSTTPIIPTG